MALAGSHSEDVDAEPPALSAHVRTKGTAMIFKPTAIGRSRVRRVALAVASAAALALCAAPIAGASSTVVVPVGGEFEQTPLTYTTSDTCGLLCSISTTRQSEGSNHYLATEYS